MPLGAFRLNTLARVGAVEEAVTTALRTPVGGFTNSTTAISTGQSKFGGSSLLSNTSTGYFQSQQNPYDWDTGDFTVEFFFYNTGQLSQFRLLFDQRDTAGGVGVALVIRDSDDDLYLYTEGAERITGDPVTANTWHHVAVTMSSGTLTLWQNGASKGTYTPSNSDFSITNGFRLSSNRLTGTSYYVGYYDELRISSVARYTTGFTPTTTAFTNDADTMALFHFDGTDGLTTIVDDTGDRARLGVNADGATDIDTTTGPITSTSIRLGADGDIIKPSRTDLGDIMFDGDYTIEAFVRHDSVASNDYIFSNRKTSFGAFGWVLVMRGDTAGNPFQYLGSGHGNPVINHQNGASINTWYHVAVVKASNIITVYVDGVASTTTYDATGDSYADADQLWFGANGTSGSQMIGYMDEIRVSNTARYTTGFSVPTERFVSDENTLLLIHGQGTDGSQLLLDDNSSARAPIGLDAEGDAQISTTQSKFGGTSASLDGTGDYIATSDPFAVGNSQDYTFEAWVRLDTASVEHTFFNNRNTLGDPARGMTFAMWTDNKLRLYVWDSTTPLVINALSSTNTLSTATWHHVAAVRSSGTWTLFLDGNLEASAAESNTPVDSGNNLWIGATHANAARKLEGYMDEIRISNVARYTASFTPATEPFKNDANTLLLMHCDGNSAQTDFLDDNSATSL